MFEEFYSMITCRLKVIKHKRRIINSRDERNR